MRLRGRRTSLATMLVVVGAALGVAACGSSSSSSSSNSSNSSSGASSGSASASGVSASNLASAKSIVQSAMAMPQFTLNAPPFNAAKAKGKLIYDIVFRSADAYIAAETTQMQQIAAKYGIKFVAYPTQGTPTEWGAGIDQAVARHASLIMIENDPHAVVPQLQKAKAAGIPVLMLHWYADGQPVPADVSKYIAAQVTAPFYPAHRADVAYVVSHSTSAPDALIITSTDITPAAGVVSHMQADFQQLCGSACHVKVIDVPATEWATKITPDVSSALNQDPNIQWVLPLFDAMSLSAAPGIQAAGKAGKVHIVTFNGTPAVLNMIQTGNIVTADAGENVNWLGYAFMDQAMRLLSGVKPIADGNEHLIFRLFTPDNIKETGTPSQAQKGYGNAYMAGYARLWSGK